VSFADFLKLGEAEAVEKLLQCCHSRAWAQAVAKARLGVRDLAGLQSAAEQIWNAQPDEERLAAFAAHPKIGDVNSLRAKYADTKATASGEQRGVDGAAEKTLRDLKHLNEVYEKKHGFIFIVFATGKSAAEMLAILESRIGNPRPLELKNAAAEQWKITKLRMEKLL
jgi:2-oxo-4-hydroxy-4-carboxy-5-ureidoimidazoline decarboxylase